MLIIFILQTWSAAARLSRHNAFVVIQKKRKQYLSVFAARCCT